MYFDDADIQDPMIGYVAVTSIWSADEYSKLVALFEKGTSALLKAAEGVPPLPVDHEFGDEPHNVQRSLITTLSSRFIATIKEYLSRCVHFDLRGGATNRRMEVGTS
jgi:hypothetical protein